MSDKVTGTLPENEVSLDMIHLYVLLGLMSSQVIFLRRGDWMSDDDYITYLYPEVITPVELYYTLHEIIEDSPAGVI